VGWRKAFIGVNAMNKEMTSGAEADEEILTFDISDAVLERAESAEQKVLHFVLLHEPVVRLQHATVALLALRQLGDISSNPPRLTACEEFGGRSPQLARIPI
jgi:hypothetical protein